MLVAVDEDRARRADDDCGNSPWMTHDANLAFEPNTKAEVRRARRPISMLLAPVA